MTAPFPGMDPFLEEPRLWESFHNRYIGALDEALSAQVRPHFYVEEQSSVDVVDRGVAPRPPAKPDVYLVDAERTFGGQPTVVAERPITQSVRVTARFPEELRQRHLEIRDGRNHAVVAVIEVLPPTNKAAGTAGREAFLRERRDLMAAPAHWIEIDLLRAGERPPEVAGLSDYYALLKGAETTDKFAAWLLEPPRFAAGHRGIPDRRSSRCRARSPRCLRPHLRTLLYRAPGLSRCPATAALPACG